MNIKKNLIKLLGFAFPNYQYKIKFIAFLVLIYIVVLNIIDYVPFFKTTAKKIIKIINNSIFTKTFLYFIKILNFTIYICQGFLIFSCIMSLFTILIPFFKINGIRCFIQLSCYQWVLYSCIAFINYIVFKKNTYKDTLFCLTFLIVLYINWKQKIKENNQ